jgi:ABC-type transport system involved in multi-copper enzyme maturation permease subunit
MFRALLWKEWRQLALIRWGGVALGAILPAAFVAGAELSQRGLLPTGTVKGYAPRDLMYELLPAALAFGLWPLIGLISVIQSLTGDRVAGTEAFLLERPVPRAVTWRARLLASFLTLIVVIAATGAIAALAAALTGAPATIGWSRWTLLTAGGVALGLLAYLGGVVAASLLPSPLGALLLGALLGALPVLLGGQLAAAFMYARIGEIFLAFVVPIALLPAFVVASWLAFCRGEPAGRGRIRRSLGLLGATLAGSLLVFIALAPAAVRANARIGQHSVIASPRGRNAFVGSAPGMGWGGGWLIDVASGAKRAFAPPPVSDVAWSPDGNELAVLTWSAPLGGVRSAERIDIISVADGQPVRSIPLAQDQIAYALAWANDGLVAVVGEPKSTTQAVEVIDPVAGTRRDTGFRSERWGMGLAGPIDDGRVFVRRTVVAKADDRTFPRGFQLLPVDVAAAKVGPAMAHASGSQIVFTGWPLGLSRSGRFARVVDPNDESKASRVVDLRPGATPLPPLDAPGARWLAGDRLVWIEILGDRTRLLIATPGAPPAAVREWRVATVGIETAPDGRAVFVSVIKAGAGFVEPSSRRGDPANFEGTVFAGAVPEEVVYLADENRFVTPGPPFSTVANDQRYTQWAGGKTLARISSGSVYLQDIERPGQGRYVIGGPR